MKHLIKNLIASAILLTACISANAQTFLYDGLWFDIESDETCILRSTWIGPKYSGDIIVPEKAIYDGKEYTVTKTLGAFWRCDELTSVSLPETITTIGDQSFENCKNSIL